MTTIAGKDAALEDTLSRFKNVARALDIEFIEQQWLNPLPDLWSVHLAIASCPEIYSNGKGSSRDAALCSAYGEMFERLATHMSFYDYYLGANNSEQRFVHFPDEKWTRIPEEEESDIELQFATLSELQDYFPKDLLNEELRKFYLTNTDLRYGHLIDLQSGAFERGICSIPFTNVSNGEIVYFPVNLIDNLYASNGMSAGNTEYEALVQGLSEIIERYVKNKIISGGLALPQVPEKILQKYPKSFATFKALQSDDLRAVCYDASLGGKFPVVCVVLFNQSNGTCVASFGSHPIFEVALDRTLTELMQGRSFSDLDGFDEPSFNEDVTSDAVNLESHFVDSTGVLPMQMFKLKPNFKFVAWDFDGNTHDQYKALRYIIKKLGFEIYVRTYQNLGVPVYRIIVPGMSEIYPIDDLLFNNNNSFLSFQESLLNLPASKETPQTYDDYFHELNQTEDLSDETLVAKLLGILPDPDSAWASLRIGELKCLLALEAENYDSAYEYAKWVVAFASENIGLKRVLFYKCLVKVLECLEFGEAKDFSDSQYKEALIMLYGKETFEKVVAHINHEQKFLDLQASDLDLTGLSAHQALIDIYQKIKHANIPMPK